MTKKSVKKKSQPPDPMRDKKLVPCAECADQVAVPVSFQGQNVICRRCSAPDWDKNCDLCGSSPIVPQTGMCGPCTWGDAATAGGNW